MNSSRQENNCALQMKNICKYFPGVKALEKVDFNLKKAKVNILLGENGAGKSTLVKILSGAQRATSGEILINNKPVSINNPKDAMKFGIGIIYQELNLIPNLSVAENIFLGREPLKWGITIDEFKMQREAGKILNQLGTNINPKVLIKDLGIAKQQMIEVAKAISLNANILIMDEPTSALSESEIKELFKTIRVLKKNGISIIYISHRMEELFEIGDIVTILRDGKKVAEKNIVDTNNDELVELMVNKKVQELFLRQKKKLGVETLVVENLSREKILKNINFSLKEGEILGIAGLLGSGRTELARAIFGIDKIDKGSIKVYNKQIKNNNPKTAISNGIGFLTEDRKTQGLIMPMSVKGNITLSSLKKIAKSGIIYSKKEKEKAEKYRTELKIKVPDIDQVAYNLSGGNQQKVLLSKWLCSNSNILILDEPTRGIDVGTKQEIYNLIDNLTETGVSVLMISSDLPELVAVCDRILVLHSGKISGQFSKSEFDLKSILQCALGDVANA